MTNLPLMSLVLLIVGRILTHLHSNYIINRSDRLMITLIKHQFVTDVVGAIDYILFCDELVE